ncbi:MAG: DUF883 domain-containing protein [Nisaea sp.]|jgi:ElaB/YqjD/DUF883 family membrane-anchored ribosome-binding protein|uniref:DUF883 family protein n=1 Tax=Nisaea sp. TaxID=2024842 RepID=UPI001B0560B1|nr:hypothetical protein [Nisaea sp.]MBO6561020.1 DUF883 domain-containing protein [Nisaea sp.]
MATAQANATTAKKASDGKNASQEDIESQLAALREDVAALAGSFADLGRSKAGEAKVRGQDMASKAAERSGAAARRVRDDLKRIEDGVSTGVRERPLRSIAIAAGIGLVAGYLIRR